MKKIAITLLVLLAVALVCVVTCPDREAHYTAVKDVINKAMMEELSGGDTDDVATILGSALVGGITGIMIDGMLTVDNYFLFSLGSITYEGETKVVSVGLLNHVFTADYENIDNTDSY